MTIVKIECEHCKKVSNFKERALKEFFVSYIECPECKKAIYVSKSKFFNSERYER